VGSGSVTSQSSCSVPASHTDHGGKCCRCFGSYSCHRHSALVLWSARDLIGREHSTHDVAGVTVVLKNEEQSAVPGLVENWRP